MTEEYRHIDKNINKYFSFKTKKDGEIVISHDEEEIYKLLYELGFRKTKIDNKIVFYRRKEYDLSIVEIPDMKDAFFDFIKSFEFENIPENISNKDILNYCYEKNAKKQMIKNGHTLDKCLTEELYFLLEEELKKNQ